MSATLHLQQVQKEFINSENYYIEYLRINIYCLRQKLQYLGKK